MCGEKSLLQEIDEINIAMGLISLGARMQVLESETSLSRRRLLRLYKDAWLSAAERYAALFGRLVYVLGTEYPLIHVLQHLSVSEKDRAGPFN